MDPLARELIEHGVLDAARVSWAEEYRSSAEIALDTALLELDLVDEEDLLSGLAKCYGRIPTSSEMLAQIPHGIGDTFPLGLSRAFAMCPVALERKRLVAIVTAPLAAESTQELRDLFGLEPNQL